MHNLARLMAALQHDDAQQPPAAPREHRFWRTQPVVQPGERADDAPGAIHAPLAPEQVRAEPYALPADFEWVTLDIEDDAQLREVYELLTANYVEDDDATLRFDYSPAFLRWALRHPGYVREWHVGVRVVSTRKLVAFIAGIPQELRVREQVLRATEINFLCVHKRLRSKRLAPVLIKEVTRRCHLSGVFQAIYTGGAVLPTPVSCARYYHRTLDAAKLLDIGFSAVPHGMSRAEHMRRFALPDAPRLPLREMTEADVPQVGRLVRRYMARFDLAARFTDVEIAHMLLSGRGTDVGGGRREGQVTWTYVVEEAGRIRDVVSFYSLPSTVLDHPRHSALHAAYLFYYATEVGGEAPAQSEVPSGPSPFAAARAAGRPVWECSELSSLTPREAADEAGVVPWHAESPDVREALKTRLNALMHDLLVMARRHGFDVVNCLTAMDNALFLHEQKFGPGDGFLRFYLFNWRVPPVPGGMGARVGESALDPAAHAARMPVSLFGCGNGIVMV